MSKVTNIPSEIRNFFNKKSDNSQMEAFSKLLESLHIQSRDLGGHKRNNCQLTNLQVFHILVMLPFFAVVGYSHYSNSVLNRMFGGKKDILYDFASQDNIDWRNIVYRIASKLISMVCIRKDSSNSKLPKVLICDDTDLPKTGKKMEKIGRIFSHVNQKSILGFKALMLCWSDGRSQFMIDASLHGEIGKTDGKEQGLTAAQRQARYSRKRDSSSHTTKRLDEYFMNKGTKLIEMVKRAIKAKIPFDYLLVDSWFTNTALVDFVCKCHKKFHLLGMAKMSNTKYSTESWGNISAKGIIGKLKNSKNVHYSRRYRSHYITVDAKLGDRDVRLFFCRRSKAEGWKVFLTTDLSLDFMRAYEIYAMRWSIEVWFADSKRLLGLSKCHARDFSSQIAHISLVIIRYNLLSSVKRTYDYDTIGGIFNDLYAGVHELTVVEKIWAIIIDVVATFAELTGADEEKLMRQIIANNKKLAAIQAYALAG